MIHESIIVICLDTIVYKIPGSLSYCINRKHKINNKKTIKLKFGEMIANKKDKNEIERVTFD